MRNLTMFLRGIAAGHRWGVAKSAQLIAVKAMSDKGQAFLNLLRSLSLLTYAPQIWIGIGHVRMITWV